MELESLLQQVNSAQELTELEKIIALLQNNGITSSKLTGQELDEIKNELQDLINEEINKYLPNEL